MTTDQRTTQIVLSMFTPSTLAAMAAEYSQYLADEAAMAAEYSQYLADEFDGGPDDLSAQQWDAMAEQLSDIVEHLVELTDDFMALLMDAGADPSIILDGVSSE